MLTGWRRALAFAWGWQTENPAVREEEVQVLREDGPTPGTLFVPERAKGPLPGWVVLHGMTRAGRRHSTLRRFVRAMSGSGAAVLIPEIREWKELKLAPEQVVDTIRASVLHLDDRPETEGGRTGVIGFSFGAPQALIASTDPVLRGHLAAVVGFGGYCDLEPVIRFLFTGVHEWEGTTYTLEPDPYGRWIVGGNHLDRTPGYRDAEDVSRALLELARRAGDMQVEAWKEVFDPIKEELESRVAPSRRDLFRTFAPPAGEPPDPETREELALALARTIRASSPLSEPTPHLDRIPVPVRLIHGREDRLIPFSETLRLARRFPANADVKVFLTGLFSHSRGGGVTGFVDPLRESYRFLRALAEIMRMI